MDVCIQKSEAMNRDIPVAYLTCNGSPPVGDKPSLMTFREVETLFHEFGHGLQHMLTDAEVGDVSGINGVCRRVQARGCTASSVHGGCLRYNFYFV